MKNIFFSAIIGSILLLITPSLYSQVVSWSPTYPTIDGTLTILYDATKRNQI
jgi:hypothetical protein